MKELFCSYSQAKELKELGFNEPCFGFYNENLELLGVNPKSFYAKNSHVYWNCKLSNIFNKSAKAKLCTAPLKQQVFSWFREKHNLFHVIERVSEKEFSYFIYDHSLIKTKEYSILDKGEFVLTYEQAESECINKLISILKEKQ